MAERAEIVRTREGTMEVFIAHPDGPDGPWPVIIQLMDGIGMREELRSHARRTASWGYYVVAPDLYHRFGFTGPLDFADADQRDKIMAAISALDADRATADAAASLKIAESDPAAAGGRIGIYGFCLGGKLTLVLSQTLGDRVAAGASLHPGNLVTDDASSPHRHIDRIAGELYFGIADNDANSTPDQMAELERTLQAQGIRYQLEWHPGALHGYMMPSRTELYNAEAAEKVWGRMQQLFARNLG
jgi:carboxymethylenebutenolidase